jgi:hypothetical protein
LLWSEERGSFVRVRALVSGVRIDRPPPETQYRDVFNLRLGAALEQRVDRRLTVRWRAGQFYEPSFVLDQPGRSNLVDGPKLGWSLGTGLELDGVLPGRVRCDLHVQLVNMLSRRHDKRVSSIETARDDPNALADEDGSTPGVQIDNPGYPYISGSGRVLTLGATLTFEVAPVSWQLGAFGLSACAALTAFEAAANPADLFGFGARGPARANAMVAEPDALSSPIYNASAGAFATKLGRPRLLGRAGSSLRHRRDAACIRHGALHAGPVRAQALLAARHRAALRALGQPTAPHGVRRGDLGSFRGARGAGRWIFSAWKCRG